MVSGKNNFISAVYLCVFLFVLSLFLSLSLEYAMDKNL